jgi:hypothetical protein
MEVASVESVESVETVETVRMLDMVVLVCGGDAPELGPRWRVHFIFRQQTRPRHVNRRTLNLPAEPPPISTFRATESSVISTTITLILQNLLSCCPPLLLKAYLSFSMLVFTLQCQYLSFPYLKSPCTLKLDSPQWQQESPPAH